MKRRRDLPPHVSVYFDRHGKPRYRYRRTGRQTYNFKEPIGSEEFLRELRACEDGIAAPEIAPRSRLARPGTFDDLIERYYRSPDFLNPGDRTRAVYRGVIEGWRGRINRGLQYGEALVRDLEARHVQAMLAERIEHRTAANMLRKRLMALMDFAVREGLASTNPVRSTKPFKVESTGFHTWTEEEIAAFEARHPLGTKARLAFDMMLWTGQRGGDARVMGPANVRGKRLELKQEKTGAIVSVPILKPLAESLLAARSGAMVFLLSEHGKPYSRKGFGNKFRQWCDEAELRHCSAHGIRKAAARRFAEALCSNQQIKAWTGHTTDSEVARYTADANKQLLSDEAGEMLLANLRTRLAKDTDKHMKTAEKC